MTFSKNDSIKNKLVTNEGNVLRNCQVGGLLATIAHFTSTSEPAIISLPTGAGKTELMFAIAFCLKPSRILIVEPSIFLRAQTNQRLHELKLFREANIIDENYPNLNVYENKTSLKTNEDWEKLQQFDAVISTPNTISPKMKHVCSPPEKLFDIVFIDEAHHASAMTWKEIVKTFSDSKIVLLTATAFRRDRRRLPGRLIYHYPIGQALDDGIYRPIEFIPVELSEKGSLDRSIAKKTSELFQRERQTNNNASLLIRTDRINKCDNLKKIYQDFGINTVTIHSEMPKRKANEHLRQIRNGNVNAVITVGMMAEGIDIPGLKIASLHAPPQSLPYTLQLVGRISRTPIFQSGPAYFVAVPEDVRGEARKLFREDREWKRIVPKLVEDAIKTAHGDKADIILKNPNISDISPELITPFFSVEVRKFVNEKGKIKIEQLPLEPDEVRGLPKVVESIDLLTEVFEGCTVMITLSTATPVWAKDIDLFETKHDLHIFYAPPHSNLLFVATTSQIISNALLDTVVDETKKIEPQKVQRALADAVSSKYVVVGLENALGLTGAHPSYKMHMGSGAGTSVRPSEGNVFGPGHAMGWMLTNEVRGIATKNRKIWAMKRKPLSKFIRWCQEIASQLLVPGSGLPGLSFLAEPLPALELFVGKPIGVVVSERHFGLPLSSLIERSAKPKFGDTVPEISYTRLNNEQMQCTLSFREDSEPIKLSYSPKRVKNWQVEDERDFEIIIPDSGKRQSLEDFLNESPPIIIMPTGGAIRGDYGWKLLDSDPTLGSILFREFTWDDTNIQNEDEETSEAMKNVQQKTQELLKIRFPKDAVIICDHGPYEIADFVVIELTYKNIFFVHCKSSTKPNPGNRIDDWYDLLGQCLRSHTWIRKGNLLIDLNARVDDRNYTKLISGGGTREDLRRLSIDFKANEWSYNVIAVQPGCKINKLKIQSNSHAYKNIGITMEWLMNADAKFEIWGNA